MRHAARAGDDYAVVFHNRETMPRSLGVELPTEVLNVLEARTSSAEGSDWLFTEIEATVYGHEVQVLLPPRSVTSIRLRAAP